MANFVPFLSYILVVTFTPGPNNIMSMANANQFGYRRTLRFILGIFSGFAVIMLLASYFSLLLYNLLPTIKPAMRIIGAAYMVYLAYQIINSTKQITDQQERINSFSTGMLMQFINLKVILYGITVVSTFITPYYKSGFTLFFFSFFLASFSFMSTSCWALFGVIFERYLSRYRKTFNWVMGLLLLYSAVSILFS